MTFYAIHKGILVSYAFKNFELDLPKDIEFKILDYLHHACVDYIIKNWYSYVDHKTKLAKRVISWLRIDPNVFSDWNSTYQLLCDCNRYINFKIDDLDWWYRNFTKMFIQLLNEDIIYYSEPAYLGNQTANCALLETRLEKIKFQLDIFNKNLSKHSDIQLHIDNLGRLSKRCNHHSGLLTFRLLSQGY